MNGSNQIDKGLDVIWSSGDIAIVVLMLMVLMQWGLIGVLLRSILKIAPTVKDALNSVVMAINILNERLNHHEEQKDVESNKRRTKRK